MKVKIIFMLFMALQSVFPLFAANEQASPTLNKEITGISELNLVQVSPSVVLLHNGKLQGSNMVCVALDEGLVFFDCGLFTEIAAEFRRQMEAKYKCKTFALVHTHSHVDHILGTGAFKDVKRIGVLKGKPMFDYQLKIDYKKYKAGFMRLFPYFDKAVESYVRCEPTQWFDDELEIGSGDDKLILKYAGGHSVCSIYAYFEKEKVLIAGDDIQVDYHLYFGDRTGDIEQWISVLKTWENMEVEHVCAGHGPLVAKDYITKTAVFLEALIQTLTELKSRNAPIDEVLEAVNGLEVYWPEQAKPTWYDSAIKSVYNRMEN